MRRSKARPAGALLALATALAAPQAWGTYFTGTEGADVLNGTSGSDVLSGRGGSDRLSGVDGADRLDGGPGDDANLSGGGGPDLVRGSEGSDVLHGGPGDDVLDGGPGADTLDGDGDTDTASYVYSPAGVTVVLGGAASGNRGGDAAGDDVDNVENLVGSAYGDTLTGTAGANVLDGGPGNDTLKPLGGADRVVGGDGADWVDYTGSQPVIVDLSQGTGTHGDAEGDTYFGVEHVRGGASNDHLVGTHGANTLAGGGGADTLEGLGGADTLQGGTGTDTVSYEHSGAGVQVDLSGPSATLGVGGDAAGDTLSDVEDLIGSPFDDTLIGTIGANTLTGGAGNDILDGHGGVDKLFGGEGSDTASYTHSDTGVSVDLSSSGAQRRGHAEGDVLSGIENLIGSGRRDDLTGDDDDNVLNGWTGADTLTGGEGSDTASYVESTAGVTVDLTRTLGQSSAGDAAGDVLSGIEHLVGSDFGDRLTGDAGDNVLTGGAGGDTLTGGAGGDTLTGGAGGDTLAGGMGSDTASYAGSAAGVTVDLTRTAIQLGAGDARGDLLSGIEHLVGSAHADRLTGDGGDNVLTGGAGGDTLTGGTGSDTASYAGSSAGVIVDLTRTAKQVSSGDAQGDVLSGIEHLVGSAYIDRLTGDANANHLEGGAGDDVLTGGAGANTFVPGPGADTVHGGDDLDTVSYEHSAEGVVVLLDAALGKGFGGDAEGDIYTSVEGVIGSKFNDVIVAPVRSKGDLRPAVLRGGEGRDVIVGGLGGEVVDGGPGADVLYGGLGGNNRLTYEHSPEGVTVNLPLKTASGGDAHGDFMVRFPWLTGSQHDDNLTLRGNGSVEGLGGADNINQAGGWVSVNYSRSPAGVIVDLANAGPQSGGDAQGDRLSGGFVRVSGSAYADTLSGTAKDNWIWGGGGADTLNGSGGNDRLEGESGADTLNGGSGNDRLEGGPGADTLHCGTEEDIVSYRASAAGVTVDLMAGTFSGGDAQGDRESDCEALYGSDHNDTLRGKAGKGHLRGYDGDDVLEGRGGDEYLSGGKGSDRFVFGGAHGTDLVWDFEDGKDRIDVSALNLAGYAAIQNRITETPYYDNRISARIDLTGHGGGIIILQAVRRSSLSAADFTF